MTKTNTKPHIIIYGKGYCPYCTMAKNFLSQHKVEMKYYLIDEDEKRNQEMQDQMSKINKIPRTVPQIFVIGKNNNYIHIGGYTDMIALHEKGEFTEILSNENISFTEN